MDKKKLTASEKHDMLYSLLTSIDQNVTQLREYCTSQFEHLNSRIDKLETKTNGINSSGPNFTKIDNKEEYLNSNIKNVIAMNIDQYLIQKSKAYVKSQNIYDILNKEYSIYTCVVNVIESIMNDNNEQFIFCFPYQKSIIYYWNNNNNTWEKMNQSVLKQIFNGLQKVIITCYNKLIQELQQENTFHKVSMKFMESGNYIFVDDFDKKYKLFKKELCEKIINS